MSGRLSVLSSRIAFLERELETHKQAAREVSLEWDEMRTALADLCSIDPVSQDPKIVQARNALHGDAIEVLRRFADHGDTLACTTAARQRKANTAEDKANDA